MHPRLRLYLASAAAIAVVVPVVWLWQASLVPDSYSVMDMGYIDGGSGPSVVADYLD